MQRATSRMPSLPGATSTSSQWALRDSPAASACSRPPLPRIKTFMTHQGCREKSTVQDH
jgi:hypothetical protein